MFTGVNTLEKNKNSYHRKIKLFIRSMAIALQALLFITISFSYLTSKANIYKETVEFQKYYYASQADALSLKTDNLLTFFETSGALKFCSYNIFQPVDKVRTEYRKVQKILEKSILSDEYFSGYYLISSNQNGYSFSYLDNTFSSLGSPYINFESFIGGFHTNNFAKNYQKMFLFEKENFVDIKVNENIKKDYFYMLDTLDDKYVYYTIKNNVLCIIIFNTDYINKVFEDANKTNSHITLFDRTGIPFYSNGVSAYSSFKTKNDLNDNVYTYSTALYTLAMQTRLNYSFTDFLFILLLLICCITIVFWSFYISKKYAAKIIEPYNILNGFFYLNNHSEDIESFDYLNMPHSSKPRSDISKNIFKAFIYAILLPTLLSSTVYLGALNIVSNSFIKNKAYIYHKHLTQEIINNFDFYISSFTLDSDNSIDGNDTRLKYTITFDNNFNLAEQPFEIQNFTLNTRFASQIIEACKKAPSDKALINIPSDIFGDKAIGLMTKTTSKTYEVTIFKMVSTNIPNSNADTGYVLLDTSNNIVLQNSLIDEDKKQKLISGSLNDIVYKTKIEDFGWTLYTFSDVSELKNKIYSTISFDILTILLFLLVMLIIAWRYSSKFLSPLERVKNAMYTGEKEINAEKQLLNESNEIEEMLNVYNKMIRHIKKITDDKIELSREEERANSLKIQAELNALQQQINPHFLYNTLEMINLNLLKFGDFTTSKVIGNLSKIFRYSISSANETVPLYEEIENTKNYLSIWDMRFPERFEFIWDVDNNLVHHKILKLILQPIMENCFFHAFDNKQNDCIIKIKIFKQNDFVIIKISDNGCGMEKEELEKLYNKFTSKDLTLTGKGIGICNTYKRLKLLCGDAAQLFIESEINKGSTITIKFKEEL